MGEVNVTLTNFDEEDKISTEIGQVMMWWDMCPPCLLIEQESIRVEFFYANTKNRICAGH